MSSFDPVPWEQTTAIVLAQQPSTDKDPGGQQEDFGKSSPLGLLVLVLFFIAVVFLVKSMSKHLKKLPASFDEPEAGTGAETAAAGAGATEVEPGAGPGPKPGSKPEAKAGNGSGGAKKDG
ncbi:hypothetical protein [Saccharothrix sp. 6-C]|uniref:hypothetical protein n=1 Tax=Saccharothrix sp. 6-C TaxID=2781735 RepID=UPI001F21E8DC|nr:hypothetical protein [Saccharothrix sp. 6-C]